MPRRGSESRKDRRRSRPRARRGRPDETGLGGPSGLLIVAAVAALAVALVAFGMITGARDAQQAPNFAIEAYQGEEVLGSERAEFAEILSRGKPVVLNFFGGSCPPCRFEMPAFQRVSDRHGEAIMVIGLDVGVYFGLGTRSTALALLEELSITYPTGAPEDSSPVRGYGIQALPSTLFFDADGKLFRRWEGTITEQQMNNVVSSVLGQG